MGRVGVLLLNLGGPDRLEDVRPFLYNLFSDPEIIRLPVPWLQSPLGVLMIVLPGPAIIVIPLGLAILGTEFAWARRLVNKARALLTRKKTGA